MSLNAKRAALLLNLAPVTSDTKLSGEPAVEHLRYTTLHEEESGLVSKITELVKSDKLNLKDLAILTRTRTEGLRLQQRLTQVLTFTYCVEPIRMLAEQYPVSVHRRAAGIRFARARVPSLVPFGDSTSRRRSRHLRRAAIACLQLATGGLVDVNRSKRPDAQGPACSP